MPKDQWARDKARDIGRKVLRERADLAYSRPKFKNKRRRKRNGLQTAKVERNLTYRDWLTRIASASTNLQLDSIARDYLQCSSCFPQVERTALLAAGKLRRSELNRLSET